MSLMPVEINEVSSASTEGKTRQKKDKLNVATVSLLRGNWQR